ncbi:helix-turn-helix transcriptional regulator [Shewanella sp. A3A]|uniref:Helix-turn-helix transcriptional regulator n=1 Tax=Shewanella electrica TaxID=515560 RepID=A0ABT2FLT0_9GAMM|nr:helix-turn-helix transcriptional regulator [Shewanella electrica]MCH1919651.1 helix-turn-helix transcriptional regulator [Shewanella ferrihydritica]MCH1925830.1 helix-turn-helix transcriptional regulator [Shewanella electrica]MCS4557285.1 helix-turn-helix transcriptional regulator [Shewanella electrica]
MSEPSELVYMSAKQVAEYLDLNEKKVYAMANERMLPATKITGKWLFPKILIDRWVMDSCHSGMLSDRMLVTGSDDPLLSMLVGRLMAEVGSRELISYSATGSRLGLELLSKGYADICTLHWGSVDERNIRHTALLKGYPNHQQWIMVHGYNRQQGLIVRPELLHRCQEEDTVLQQSWRWVTRQGGAGSQQHLEHWLMKRGATVDSLNAVLMAFSERELAGSIARNEADIGFGCQAVAQESGLGFVPLLTESFDFVMPQGIYFRRQLQQLFKMLLNPGTRQMAAQLGGYDLTDCGQIIWSPQ